MESAYDKLLRALKNNQLYEYLVARGNYRVLDSFSQSFDINNDYFQVSEALNDYGKDNIGFDKKVNYEMKQILLNNKLFEIYSVCQLVRLQIIKDSVKKNEFTFIDEELLNNLKNSINKNRKAFENAKDFEGACYDKGIYGQFEAWNNELSSISENKIL